MRKCLGLESMHQRYIASVLGEEGRVSTSGDTRL